MGWITLYIHAVFAANRKMRLRIAIRQTVMIRIVVMAALERMWECVFETETLAVHNLLGGPSGGGESAVQTLDQSVLGICLGQ